MNKITLISIKPEFSNKIFDGTKKIELRKSKPNIEPGNIILIYNTTPQKALVGFGILKNVIELEPYMIWKMYSNVLGVNYQMFSAYYEGRSKAIGLQLENVKKFNNPKKLSEIREKNPSFSPPQSFKYLNIESLSFLDDIDISELLSFENTNYINNQH